MCGIVGQICFSDYRAHPVTLRNMLVANQIRGRDAAGVAYLHRNKLNFLKAPVEPRDFADKIVNTGLWKTISQSSIVLLHARGASQGKPDNNENNHPVVAADWMVTHNGRIHNDDDLIAYYGMTEERPAEVDSVAINLALAQGETVEESLSHAALLGGPATFAAISLKKPNEVILARMGNGSPVYINWVGAPHNIIFWSSDPDGLRHSAQTVLGGLQATNVSVLPNNQALVISTDPARVRRYEITNNPFRMPYVPKGGKKDNSVPFANTVGKALGKFRSQPISTDSKKGKPQPSSTETVQTIMERWFADPGKTGTDLVTLWDATDVRGLLNYIKLAKPEPLFETDMIGMALNPPGGTDVPLSGKTIRTPYGTWTLYPKERIFKPMKRVRKHFIQNVEVPLGISVKFPADDNLQEALRDTYLLEGVKIKSHDGSVRGMLMCPWCGIMSKGSVWNEWNRECSWCYVTSLLDRKEE